MTISFLQGRIRDRASSITGPVNCSGSVSTARRSVRGVIDIDNRAGGSGMTKTIKIEIEIDDDDNYMDYKFEASEKISLRNLSYYFMEAMTGLVNDWDKDEED